MIGIFGGTFDPVHFGHLRPALEVARTLEMAQIRFIPCFIPPHRDEPGATAAQRLRMLRLALAGVDEFVVDERELKRGGPSYMVDTLASLRQELGDAPVALILGRDAFAGLASWHRWWAVLELAHIVVLDRPGAALPQQGPVAGVLARHGVDDPAALHRCQAGRIWLQTVTQLDISATLIRRSVNEGGGCRFLTPEPVREYIEAQGLYLSTTG